MTGTLTYTGVTGPAQALTATVFSNVQRLEFDVAKEVLHVVYDQPEKTAHLDIRASATMTATLVAGVSLSVTIS